jgi:heme o synthase
MKASVPPLTAAHTGDRLGIGIFLELAKARLTALVLFTTLVGFYMGSPGSPNLVLMFSAIVGTALVAAGSAALNQVIEKDHDLRMVRTESRPLPSGRLSPESARFFGLVCAGVGLIWLALAVNLITCLLGLITLLSYLFVYTPLKRISPLNTVVGALAGGLPPLMGWTAARGEVSAGGWALFVILFLWQLPHFLAIAWIYREEYANAGFRMLPVVDPSGIRTGRQALVHSVGLLAVSVGPFLLGLSGTLYLVVSLLMGAAFLGFAFRFWQDLTHCRARQLFFMSIIYLPILLGVMVFDKIG